MPTEIRTVPYHVPYIDGREKDAIASVLDTGRVGGGGPQLDAAERALRERLGSPRVLAVTSCTHALEMAMLLAGVEAGGEVIVPSFTFSSTATCVLSRGATPVFADCRPGDPNVDPEDVARKINDRTQAIVLVHYGGVAADVDALAELARARGIPLVEDAAHALDARWRDRPCGAIADFGCFSFHGSKNVTCGEGGALFVSDEAAWQRAERIREMGTNRAQARRREAEDYTWLDQGSSNIPSEISMAMLAVQLEKADRILTRRRRIWDRYLDGLAELERAGALILPRVPTGAEPNGHIFHVLARSADEREVLRRGLLDRGVTALTHYVPLDDSPYGRKLHSEAHGGCPQARDVAGRILRLPIHPSLSNDDQDYVIESLRELLRGGETGS